jgi:mRNA-degrading endonuclease toxin of MazEF toxin-antitoxin module
MDEALMGWTMGWMIEGMSAAAAVVVTSTRSQFSLQYQLLHLEPNYRQHSTLQVDQFSNLDYVPVKTPLHKHHKT